MRLTQQKIFERMIEAEAIRDTAQSVYEKEMEHLKGIYLNGPDAPYRIGETITTTGYSYRGKPMIVESIFVRLEKHHDWMTKNIRYIQVTARGHVVKIDGTVGKATAESATQFEVPFKKGTPQ